MYIPTVYFLLSFKFPDRKLQTVKKKEKKRKNGRCRLSKMQIYQIPEPFDETHGQRLWARSL
jgi:hypothetical protein